MITLSAPGYPIKATVQLTGSKSICNRLLILKEVLNIETRLENFSDSDDTRLLQQALNQLSAGNLAHIDVHHAGTDMRFLTALLATKEGSWTLTGSSRLQERPIAPLVDALRTLGADIRYTGKENFPPLLIKGKILAGGEVTVDSSISSQFVSALLLIAPGLKNGLTLNLSGNTVSKPYIAMTVSLLKQFNVQVEQAGHRILVQPFSSYPEPVEGPSSITSNFSPLTSYLAESDWSSASYWYSICALAGNAEIELRYLSQKSLQADSVLPEIYKALGVRTTFKEHTLVLRSTKPGIREFRYNFSSCPDIAQTVAVTCFGLGIKAELTGLGTLKVKETDRISALKRELEKLGAQVTTTGESLSIAEIPASLDKGPHLIHTYHDHRMAMSFAPLALFTTLHFDDPSVVAKSYPGFWDDLKSVGFNVNLQA